MFYEKYYNENIQKLNDTIQVCGKYISNYFSSPNHEQR